MARIPMKGDSLPLEQFTSKYGDPIDKLASLYFDCLSRAEQQELAGQPHESAELWKMAESCRKEMAKYGFVPKLVEGEAKAQKC